MREYLTFQLSGPMASFGTYQGALSQKNTANHPTKTAIAGLLGACLGIENIDFLNDFAMASLIYKNYDEIITDFHTAQSVSNASLKNKPHQTRLDEIKAINPKKDFPIISRRQYLQNFYSVIAITLLNDKLNLVELKKAIKKPHYVIYIGRKSCTLDLPMNPIISSHDTIEKSLNNYPDFKLKSFQKEKHYYWDSRLSSNLKPKKIIKWIDKSPNMPVISLWTEYYFSKNCKQKDKYANNETSRTTPRLRRRLYPNHR